MRDEETSLYLPEQVGGILRRLVPGATDLDVKKAIEDLFMQKMARAGLLSPEAASRWAEELEAYDKERDRGVVP